MSDLIFSVLIGAGMGILFAAVAFQDRIKDKEANLLGKHDQQLVTACWVGMAVCVLALIGLAVRSTSPGIVAIGAIPAAFIAWLSLSKWVEENKRFPAVAGFAAAAIACGSVSSFF